jgi:Xaa-Pro aminopeptidase
MPRPSIHADRLARLRALLHELGVDGFYLPRTDEHGSEYLPASAARVAWLTGFTGSAAQVIVLAQDAAVFSDGRYTVQLAREVEEALFERCHSTEQPPSKWLARKLPPTCRLGYDPFLVRRSEIERLTKAVAGKGGALVPLSPNPVDAVWLDRPAPPLAPVFPHPERFAGESSAVKRQRIAAEITAKNAQALVVTAADSIAWLLNIRGRDIPYNPLCLSFVILNADGTCRWFVDHRKLPADLALDNAVGVEPYESFGPALTGYRHSPVLVDPDEVHLGYLLALEEGGACLIEAANPIGLAKASKNAAEIAGATGAQQRDGAAVARFLAWLDAQPQGTVDEIGAALRLNLERAKDPLFQGESFPTISAHGPDAALPHYRQSPLSNRRLTGGTVYLVDSGGQYLDATTDITRTVALGEVPAEIRERFTLVLKGHIAIAVATFPKGTTGGQLDSFARAALWRHGLDFDHGTGHGIGAYLCVHEGPQRISKTGGGTPLEPGMIISNEPGYYKEGQYGIRIENLVLVEERGRPQNGDRELLGFRTLTLCPFDRRLILPSLLTVEERAWVDDYHAQVLGALRPGIADEAGWLDAACAPLETSVM